MRAGVVGDDIDNAAMILMMMSQSIDAKRLALSRNRLFSSIRSVFYTQRARHAAYVERARRDSALCRSEMVDLRALCAAQAAEICSLRSRPAVAVVPGTPEVSLCTWIPDVEVSSGLPAFLP